MISWGLVLAGWAASAAFAQEQPDSNARGTQVYVYPNKGQTAEQIDRDRYECYVWAVDQTHFDPSLPQLAPHQRVEVLAAPGVGAASGAMGGAVIGAVISRPSRSAEGAIVGAVIGGVLGSAAEAARERQAAEAQKRIDERETQEQARLDEQSSNYRRALTACLEGRGYTVK
jgi:hypothetical protein